MLRPSGKKLNEKQLIKSFKKCSNFIENVDKPTNGLKHSDKGLKAFKE